MFHPIDVRGRLVDPDAMTLKDFGRLTLNGPEWAHAAKGDHIVYTKFVTGKPHLADTARISVAREVSDGSWSIDFLVPDASRLAPYASDFDLDQSPVITDIDKDSNLSFRGTGAVKTERLLSNVAPSVIPIRPVCGARALLLHLPVDGGKQVHYYDISTRLVQQLTFDDGLKAAS